MARQSKNEDSSISPESRKIIRDDLRVAYQATHASLSEHERGRLALYVVVLKLIHDLLDKRPELLHCIGGTGWDHAANGLDHRSMIYRNAATELENLQAPKGAERPHNRLVRSLRDLAAIDRRGAAEVRVRRSVDHYLEGETEMRKAAHTLSESVKDGVEAMRSSFKNGKLKAILTSKP